MKKIIALILAVVFVLSLCACGAAGDTKDTSYEKMMETYEHSKSLIVYFSETGNTNTIAQEISAALKADSIKLTPVEPYDKKDLETKDETSKPYIESQDKNARPVIETEILNFDEYETVFIGYPIWYGDAPKIIYSFLDKFDCSKKVVVPFCTSSSSDITDSVANLKATYPNLTIANGKRFEANASQEEVETWLKADGYMS